MMTTTPKPWALSRNNSPGAEAQRILELCGWVLLLLICNRALWSGGVADHLVYFPALVKAGEWRRALLFPLVHVGWYHLVLDAGAFLLLWKGIDEGGTGRRWWWLAACWAGSLLAPLWFSPNLPLLGLCGLSGVCHGLMAVSALELAASKSARQTPLLGLALFLGLFAKVCWEVQTGAAFLADLHLGPVGIPIVSSHLGGFLGGAAGFGILYLRDFFNNNKNQIYEGEVARPIRKGARP